MVALPAAAVSEARAPTASVSGHRADAPGRAPLASAITAQDLDIETAQTQGPGTKAGNQAWRQKAPG